MVEIFGAPFSKKVPFFHKKVSFLANIEHCPKFLEYALTVDQPSQLFVKTLAFSCHCMFIVFVRL